VKETTISIDAKESLVAGEKYVCSLEPGIGEEGVPAGGKIRIALPCYWAWSSPIWVSP